ncbi:hypothetical protein [Flavobacterium sp. WG21]|uniref:hypothetical protein n=1 Tax=Flavobacterium sp. WG21 TaxID=1229487 RepID=UPI000344A11D|nr:hypothetical protein [Flavobacterium sp. WG21]
MKNTNPKESKHHISKPLQLNSVPQSEDKLDSVLVRGADKIVKHVPRSQFSNGSTQTLQQVLDNGGDYHFSTPGAIIDIGVGISNGGFSVRNTNPSTESQIHAILGSLTLGVKNTISGTGWSLGSPFNPTSYEVRSFSDFWHTTLKFQDQNNYTGNSVLTIPNKVGDHTIATLADIPQTLQQTLDNGNILNSRSVISFPRLSIFNGNISMNSNPFTNQMDVTGNTIENNEDHSRFEANSDKIKLVNSIEPGGLIFSPTYDGTGTTYTNATSPVNGGGVKQVIPVSVNSITPDPITGNINLPINLQTVIDNQGRATGEFTLDSEGLTSNTRVAGGTIDFKEGNHFGSISPTALVQTYNNNEEVLLLANGNLKFEWDGGRKSLNLSLRNLKDGNLNVKFPNKASGNYNLMYREDLATYNPTTINLSLTELDNSYPDAIPGFRVHCNSISSGALIYENTSAGWLQITASIV